MTAIHTELEQLRPAPPLSLAAGDDVWVRDLAQTVCGLIERQAGVSDVLVAIRIKGASAPLDARCPQERLPSEGLLAVADEAMRLGVPIMSGAVPGRSAPGGVSLVAAALLPFDDEPAAAVLAVELRARDQDALTSAMDIVNLALGWTAAAFARTQCQAAVTRAGLSAGALGAVVTLAETPDLAESLQALAIDLKERFACDRVAVGMVRFRRARVSTISNAVQISRSQPLVRNLAAAMEEALDQGSPLYWPHARAAGGEAARARVTEAQATLAEQDSRRAIYTVPMVVGERQIGALVFERHDGRGFERSELEVLEAVASTLSPLLEEKRNNDRYLAVKALVSLYGVMTTLVGRRHFAWKAVGLAVVAVVAVLASWQVPHSVKAEATVEGVQLRQVAASFEGFIAEAPVREGDRVAAGDLLVRLDDREQALELLRLTTQAEEIGFDLDRTVGEQDPAAAQILRARLQQIEAQRLLIEERMRRMQMTAPFDAVVLSGDPTRSVGRAVAQGEPLLTIAPAGEYRIRLAVAQADAALIRPGQAGKLRLAAHPDREMPVTVRDIVPVAESRDGRTVFFVEARFVDEQSDALHGLEGRARLEAGNRNLAAVWVGPFWDQLRLQAWAIGLF